MEIDQEIKNLIDEYVKEIENKEGELVSFKSEINDILSDSKKELTQVTADLNLKFNDNSINEEEYLGLFRKAKEDILEQTKEKLTSLLKGLESIKK